MYTYPTVRDYVLANMDEIARYDEIRRNTVVVPRAQIYRDYKRKLRAEIKKVMESKNGMH